MLLLLLSAILLILAFPNFNLTFLAFIGFVPLLFAIQKKSPKKAFFISYACGFLFYLGVLYWLYHVTAFGLIVLCLYLALYFGIFGFLFNRFIFYTSRFTILFMPLIWTILEYIQSHLFTGFGWALLGYSQYRNLPLIQIADFSGVYGVSFVIMMSNVIAWRLTRAITEYRVQSTEYREKILFSARPEQRRRVLRSLFSLILIFLVVYSYGFFRLREGQGINTVKVSVIQGNIPQEIKWETEAADSILDKYSNLTMLAVFDKPDLVIWPETSFPGFFVSDGRLTERALDLVKETGIPLLLGANTEKDLDSFNSAVLISRTGKILDKYDKVHLVPFGEYVPFSDRLPFLHNLVLGELGAFTPGNEFKVFSASDRRFSVLICFEDIFPELSRNFVKNGARFLVVITNDAWYGKSGAPYQHAACSVFRAIENRVPLIRCANTGYSCFIDSKGRIYSSVEQRGTHLFIPGHKTSDVFF